MSRLDQPTSRLHLLLLGGLLLLVGWVYWPTFGLLARTWQSNPDYSHAYLIPVFSLYLLYRRRERLEQVTFQANFWGVGLLVVGGLIRVAGAYLGIEWLEAISLIPCLAGLVQLLGGYAALKWVTPSVGFLVFMIPLPFGWALALAGPLRSIATKVSVYVMQTAGLPAIAEGNVILVDDHRIAVAEACSGLSMLFVFIALSVGMVLIIRRSWLEKTVLLLSAIPIAVISNVIRITVTGLALVFFGQKTADVIFHDLAGWFMMPLALGLMWLELQLIQFLFPPTTSDPATGQTSSAEMTMPAKQKKSRANSAPPDQPFIPGLSR